MIEVALNMASRNPAHRLRGYVETTGNQLEDGIKINQTARLAPVLQSLVFQMQTIDHIFWREISSAYSVRASVWSLSDAQYLEFLGSGVPDQLVLEYRAG